MNEWRRSPHWQSGLQRSGWLQVESAWSVALCVTQLARAVINSQYWHAEPLRSGRCRRACKASSTWTSLGSSSLSLLACWSQSLRASTCCYKFWSWSFKLEKAEGVNLKPCRGMCMLWRAARPAPAQCSGTCQPYALGLGASLTWSCRPGVTVFSSRRCSVRAIDWAAQLAAEAGPGDSAGKDTATIWNALCQDERSLPNVQLLWCLLWSKY